LVDQNLDDELRIQRFQEAADWISRSIPIGEHSGILRYDFEKEIKVDERVADKDTLELFLFNPIWRNNRWVKDPWFNGEEWIEAPDLPLVLRIAPKKLAEKAWNSRTRLLNNDDPQAE
jgi:hypothetical protein